MIRELEHYGSHEKEEPSFRKEIEPMTRAEWVKLARAECEKELEYYEELRRRAEEYWKEEGSFCEQREETVQMEEGFPSHCRYVELSEEDGQEKEMEEEPEGMSSFLDSLRKDISEEESEASNASEEAPQSFEWSYLTKFTVRLITAVVIALFVITIDYFGIASKAVNSDAIKTAIQKNDTIESVEESVTVFTKEKVLPIFQKNQ